MAKTVTLRLEDDVYKAFIEHAAADKRSLANFIELAALQYTKESEFIGVEEMSDILNDSGLIRRLKSGTSDAKKGKGRFVA